MWQTVNLRIYDKHLERTGMLIVKLYIYFCVNRTVVANLRIYGKHLELVLIVKLHILYDNQAAVVDLRIYDKCLRLMLIVKLDILRW